MAEADLILTLASGLTAALIFGYLTHRLGLSPIVGYLLAGVVVGTFTPGHVANQDLARQLAEVGVILLLFGVGLHFHLRELWAVRRVAIPGAVGQMVASTALAAAIATWIGWDVAAGVVFGIAISVASTVVLIRVLTDHRNLHTPTGHVAIGWSVVQDLLTVVVLVLVPALFGAEEVTPAGVIKAVAWAAVKIAGLVALVYFAGGRVIPWLLERVAKTRSRELFTLTVLVLALGIAVGSARVFGVSMALGAFLAGMVVGRSEFSLRAASEALPMRDAFAVLFFVSIGMLFRPAALLEAPALVIAMIGVVVIAKPLVAIAVMHCLRYPPLVTLAAAVALAQIGEFSFVVILLGNQLGIVPAAALDCVVVAAIISITVNPLLYRAVEPIVAWAERQPKLWRVLNARVLQPAPAAVAASDDDDNSRAARHRSVVVGYGPVGRTVTRLLRENDIEPTIIELDLAVVRRLRESGVRAVYGDARHRDTLKNAGVKQARSLVLSASGLDHCADVIRLARELNPRIQVLARSTYLRELQTLRAAGASSAFSGEGEIALAFTVAILRDLGATPEQIDRERERVYAELRDEQKETPSSARPVVPLDR